MTAEENLRDALKRELTKEVLDYGQILELAHGLSKEDQQAIRFSVDASHISRLGLELVSKQETAISELIKNAYDADAITVDVIFKNSDTPGGSLEITDSGNGMSRDQLLNGFMRISTTSKVDEPASPIFTRQRAGRKGIGRFSAQRLGRKLFISTQQEGVNHSLEMSIDWDQFSAGQELFMVANKIVESPPSPSKGTTIRIDALRDAWSEAQIHRAFRYVSDLLQPFPIVRKDSSNDSTLTKKLDPGFKVSFYKEKNGDFITVASDEQDIFSNAIAHIEASVNESGNAQVSLTSTRYKNAQFEKGQLKYEKKVRSPVTEEDDSHKSLIGRECTYDLLRGIHLTAYYFIDDVLPTGTRRMVRGVLSRTGGIRIYRNGFRVLPYGENFDDWLGLQRSSALRQLLPPHHNANFIGFVEITDLNGDRFEETASREGLIENEAFKQLRDFVYRALVAAVIEIARVRQKKIFATDPPVSKSTPVLSLQEQVDQVSNRVRELGDIEIGSPNSSISESSFKKLTSELADDMGRIKARYSEEIEELEMLRVLASLGLTIGEFTHEMRHTLATLIAVVDDFGIDDINKPDIFQLKEQIMLLRDYMRYFDDAVIDNTHRTLAAHELRDVINKFVQVMRPTLKRQGVEIEVIFDGYDLFTRPMHKSEWSSILLNLLTNSLKAIQRARVHGRIRIVAREVDDELQIDFSDNGDGISKENREKIFDAFFTTSAPSHTLADDTDQLVGTGLGLKIVKDIINAAGGDIEVIDSVEDFSTCMRLTIPRAQEDQIDDEQY